MWCVTALVLGVKFTETEHGRVWTGAGELVLKGHGIAVWEDEKVLEANVGDGCTAFECT